MQLINKFVLAGLICLSLNLQNIFAQEDFENKGHFFISPDFGLLLGTVTRIEVAPMLGYYLTNRLSLSAGVRYEYYREARIYLDPLKTHIYGPRFQLKFTFIENLNNILPFGLYSALFFQAENETLSLESKYFGFPSAPEDGRFWHNITLVGGGLRQPASKNLFFNAAFLWDIDNSFSSPYINPVIRIGLQYNFGQREEKY